MITLTINLEEYTRLKFKIHSFFGIRDLRKGDHNQYTNCFKYIIKKMTKKISHLKTKN